MKKILLLLGLIVTACASNYNGIDISHHNKKIDWEEVKNDSNLVFCYVKATQGSDFIDPKHKHNFNKAKECDLKVGFYHYFSSHSSGKDQFENFDKILQTYKSDLIPVIDIETPCNDFSDVSKLKVILSDFLEAFNKKYGYYPIVYYGDYNSYKLYLTARKCKPWFRTVHFSQYVPNILFQQIAVETKFNNKIDLNYCKNINYLCIK